jgi:lysophospholipase L1-like esterase
MKKSIKIFSALIAVIMLISMLPFSAAARDMEEEKLYITHINEHSAGKEGVALILTPASGETVLPKGKFEWWRLVTFEWDATAKCYKVTKIQLNANNVDKSSTAIPDNGFVYAINTGNDYSPSGGINYQTPLIKNCFDALEGLTLGMKAYVYKADLKNDIVDTNNIEWYKPEYKTNSYIKLVSPESTGTPYNPESSEELEIQYTIGLTDINTATYQTGMSKIFTRAFGTDIVGTGSGKYQWWKVAVFDWNDANDCYEVISIDIATGSVYEKHAIIPENGFAIAVITGNDVTNAASTAMDKIKVGSKAYLYGVDLVNNKIENKEKAKITINLPDTTLTPSKPVIKDRLTAPVLKMAESGDKTITTEAGFEIIWKAVEGATGYVVNVNNSTVTNNGPFIVKNVTKDVTSYTIGSGVLKIGRTYTVSVYAVGTNRSASMISRAEFSVISSEASNSSLHTKKIVAFGDSLTQRTGWVKYLGGRFGIDIINAGIGGDSSTNGKERFQNVLDEKADIVIINFGMNDQAVGTGSGAPLISLATYTSNLEYFAKTLTEAGTHVVFVTPNKVYKSTGYYQPGGYNLDYSTDSMLKFCDAMRKVALKYGCGIVDINNECNNEDLSKFLISGDGIHQTEYGHDRYADYIGDYLAAVYDNKNLGTVEIKLQDASGNSIAQSITLKGAVGANVIIPGVDIAGNRLVSTPSNYKFTATPGSVTLKYEPIVIELKENSGFTVDENYVFINAEKMTAQDVLAKVKTAGVTCALSEGKHVGTGSKLQLKSGSEVMAEMTIVLMGDVDGDGEVSAIDYYLLKKHILGNYTLKDAYLIAGNTDETGGIDSVDYLLLKKHILGNEKLF